MKRSQINHAIDKALAMAEAFRISLPEFAHFTASAGRRSGMKVGMKSGDPQLGWDVTDFASGCFRERALRC